MANKQININFNNGSLIDETGAILMTVPTISYKANPTWELHFVTVAEDGAITPVNLTSATAWHAAIDTDFDSDTDPMVRTLDTGIDHSDALSGILKVSLNAATSSFYEKVNKKERVQAYFEVRGIDGEDKVIYDYHFRTYALGAIDPEGGEPLPIESGGVTINDVNAIVNGAVNGLQPLITESAMLDYDLISGAPLVPSKTSDLYNDSGFVTITAVNAAVSGKQDKIDANNKLDYSLLSGTPTIPTVNDATITFTQGGTTKGTITLNQSSDATIALDAGGGGGGGDYDAEINYLSGIIDAQNARLLVLEGLLSGFAQELMTFTVSGNTTERMMITSGMTASTSGVQVAGATLYTQFNTTYAWNETLGCYSNTDDSLTLSFDSNGSVWQLNDNGTTYYESPTCADDSLSNITGAFHWDDFIGMTETDELTLSIVNS